MFPVREVAPAHQPSSALVRMLICKSGKQRELLHSFRIYLLTELRIGCYIILHKETNCPGSFRPAYNSRPAPGKKRKSFLQVRIMPSSDAISL